uniref:Uncharacterized protein n=1 Tax=uncultured prokaryote TaxID=198431 RepID=H5S983_9ZZZZ|nr:hypothetical protein HGMM_F03A04C42 [uncultured prokaryote]
MDSSPRLDPKVRQILIAVPYISQLIPLVIIMAEEWLKDKPRSLPPQIEAVGSVEILELKGAITDAHDAERDATVRSCVLS